MSEYPHYASIPILAGPYSRRRLVRLRANVRQIAMIAATVMAASVLVVLAF